MPYDSPEGGEDPSATTRGGTLIMAETPIHEFTSHIAGKNAKVRVFQDRIEWERPRGISGGKITAGLMTGGLSLLATGVKSGDGASEMIPIRAISSVTTKRDGFSNSKVSVIATCNTIDFRVSHGEAAQIKDTILRLMTQA